MPRPSNPGHVLSKADIWYALRLTRHNGPLSSAHSRREMSGTCLKRRIRWNGVRVDFKNRNGR